MYCKSPNQEESLCYRQTTCLWVTLVLYFYCDCSFISDQVSEISSRLNSSRLHLDELKRNSTGGSHTIFNWPYQSANAINILLNIVSDHTSGLQSVERHLEELKTQNIGEKHYGTEHIQVFSAKMFFWHWKVHKNCQQNVL